MPRLEETGLERAERPEDVRRPNRPHVSDAEVAVLDLAVQSPRNGHARAADRREEGRPLDAVGVVAGREGVCSGLFVWRELAEADRVDPRPERAAQ